MLVRGYHWIYLRVPSNTFLALEWQVKPVLDMTPHWIQGNRIGPAVWAQDFHGRGQMYTSQVYSVSTIVSRGIHFTFCLSNLHSVRTARATCNEGEMLLVTLESIYL